MKIRKENALLRSFFCCLMNEMKKKSDANDCDHHHHLHDSLNDFQIVITRKGIVRKETRRKIRISSNKKKSREKETDR